MIRVATVCIAVLAAAGGCLSAQDISVGGRLGFVGAAAKFEDDEADRIDASTGLQIAGFAAYDLGSILSVQLELSYIQKGWAEGQTGGARKLSYLELPLLVTIGAPWNTSPHLVAGPAVSFELTCTVTGIPGVGSTGCRDPQVAWDRAKTHLGVWFGLGLGRRLGNNRLDLQLMGNVTLTDLNREELPRGYISLLTATASVAYKTSLWSR
jgi:hypothetical protein